MLYAFFCLIRPLNGLISFLSVILGAFLAAGTINPLKDVAIVAFAAFLLTSAGNALNDFWDVEADRINKPSRPIPSGKIKRRYALILGSLLFIIGTGLGLLVNLAIFTLFFLASALLILYTIKMRGIILIGNTMIGLLTGLTLIAGGIAVNTIRGVIIPAIFAFLITMAREIIKDVEDMKGDRISGLSSLPLKIGQKKSIYISLVFTAFIILISPWPYILNIYSFYYLICIIFGVDLILAYCIIMLLIKFTEKTASRVSILMKIAIILGLGALYSGKL